jgi:hypothetical protein
LRYRVRSAEGSTLVATLKQGATTIATRTHSALGTDWTTLEMNLSGSETDAITDYTDLTVTFAASDGVTWTPLELFAADEVGVWYDPSDFDTMWKDTAGTTPVTAVDDLVARIDDKSGNGFHATQATEANRPVLKQDSNGNYYLLFDGTNDGMVTSAIDFTSTDEISVFAGVRKLSDAATAMFVELSANVSGSTGSFYFTAPESTSIRFGSISRGGASISATQRADGTGNAPITVVASSTHDISGDLTTLRINTAASTNATGDKGTGNFGNHELYIGTRGGGSLHFNGWLYSLIVRGALSDSTEIDEAEVWVNGKTEAY